MFFFVDKDVPCIGASPDALVECLCCKKGVVEIKCMKIHYTMLLLNVKLFESQLGLQLRRYFMQCQLQIHVIRRSYCDFVVWNPSSPHTGQIVLDETFILEALAKAECFFNICILPELAGKYFTCSKAKVSEIELPDTLEQDKGNYCFCKESKGGDIVACDSSKCSIKWFHMSCLQMDTPPREKWVCPTCQLKRKRKLFEHETTVSTKHWERIVMKLKAQN